jgi:hypothetical protein
LEEIDEEESEYEESDPIGFPDVLSTIIGDDSGNAREDDTIDTNTGEY